MNNFVEDIEMEVYNKIVDILEDRNDIDFDSIDRVLKLGFRVIFRYFIDKEKKV